MKRFANGLREIVLGRTRRDAALLLQSGLFDLGFYASKLDAHEKPSISHFLREGWRRGLSPSPFFDSAFYLFTYQDVKKNGWNPVLHYVRHGWQEGRAPHPRFDVAKYIASHPDVDFRSVNPLQHCIEHYGSLEWGSGVSRPGVPSTSYFEALAAEQRQLVNLIDCEVSRQELLRLQECLLPCLRGIASYQRYGEPQSAGLPQEATLFSKAVDSLPVKMGSSDTRRRKRGAACGDGSWLLPDLAVP